MNTQTFENIKHTGSLSMLNNNLRPGQQAAKGHYWIPQNTKDFSDQPAFKEANISFNTDESSSLSAAAPKEAQTSNEVVHNGEVVTIGEYQSSKSLNRNTIDKANTVENMQPQKALESSNVAHLNDSRMLKMKLDANEKTDFKPNSKEVENPLVDKKITVANNQSSAESAMHLINQTNRIDLKAIDQAQSNVQSGDLVNNKFQDNHNSPNDRLVFASKTSTDEIKNKSRSDELRLVREYLKVDLNSQTVVDNNRSQDHFDNDSNDQKQKKSKQEKPDTSLENQNVKTNGDLLGEAQKIADKESTTAFGNETAKKILRQMERFRSTSNDTFRFTLSLPEGDVTIRLSMHGNKIKTHFISDSKEFSNQLQEGWDQLFGLAKKNGIDLAYPTLEQK